MSKNPFSIEEKLFSVICPVYKDAYKTFDKFFQALNEQDYKRFEVIVVFDGENKSGQKELNKMKEKYPEMSISSHTIEHGGAPKARNYGASVAKGDYLTFTDPDIYWYPESFRFFANSFEEHTDKDVIWGLYELEHNGQKISIGGSVPVDASGTPQYYAFRSSNYCSGAFPIRKEAFIGWDETVKSLQDWDMWIRMLKTDNFEGRKFLYFPRNFFFTDPPRDGGISDDSHRNWIDRVTYVREKNGIPQSDICVCSLGAPFHGVSAAKTLGADYLPMPSYKPHKYKAIYLLGFYTAEGAAEPHMRVFNNFDGKKIIHWIGTDVLQMHWNCSFQKLKALRRWFKENKVIHITEAKHTYEEMKELGIGSHIIPIPPQKLYEPMPLPKQFTVAVYENSTQNMYGEEMMQQIVRSMPDVQFKFFGDETKKGIKKGDNEEHLGWVDMDKFLPEVSCNLRVSVHDGLPLTPLQFLTAGRSVVCNTKLYGAIFTDKSRKNIVSAIRKAQKQVQDASASRYWNKELSRDKYSHSIRRLI